MGQYFHQFLSNLKIRQKIQFSCILSLGILFLIFLLFYGAVAGQTVMGRAQAGAMENLQQIELYFQTLDKAIISRSRHLDTSLNTLALLKAAEDSAEKPVDWTVQALLDDVRSLTHGVSVELYTTDGRLVSESSKTTALHAPQRLPADTLHQTLLRHGENFWQDDAKLQDARTSGLSIYRAIVDESGQAAGIVRIPLDALSLADLYTYIQVKSGSTICLFSRKNNLILPRDIPPDSLRTARLSLHGNGQTADWSISRHAQQKYFAQEIRLEQQGLCAVIVSSYAPLMQDVHTLQIVIALLGLTCALVQLIFFRFLGDTLAQPIVDLSRKMGQVRDEALDVRSSNTSKDEVGLLSQSFNEMLDRISQMMAEIKASEKRRHELELISLQTQITPHFLYNTLDSISALAQLGDTEGVFEMSSTLGEFYRGVLSDGRSVISLGEELNITANYLQIQSFRYRDRFQWSIQVDESLFHYSIVKLTIQPLVENAIYHGIREVRRHGILTIGGHQQEDRIILWVEDNGKGMQSPEQVLSGSPEKGDLILHRRGYGMFNADQRIKLYFGEEYGLRVASVPDQFTRVEVHLPLRPYAPPSTDQKGELP